MPLKTKSAGFLYILLLVQFFSVLKLFQSDIFDRFYGVSVLGFGAFCLFTPNLVHRLANRLKSRIPMVHNFLSTHSVTLIILLVILNTTNFSVALILIIMFLLPLAILESDNDLLRRNFLETNKSRIFALVVFWLGLIAFFLNFLKTPFSLTDYHHTQYIADEMQIQLTENKAYSSYAAQYSNLLGPIFGLFIHGVSPIDLEISTIWLLIILQYIGVAIFFVLIIKLGRGSQLKYSLLFSSSLLGGAFFYSQSTLDWLQNFPARTFFPILCILMISIRLKFNNLKTSVWRNLGGNSLDVLIGGLAALSIANDPIFGAPLSIAIFLITILDRENPISVKILRTCLIFCSCMIVLLSINEFFFHPSELPKDLSLFTHYIIQYSSQGFGESYSFFGPDVVFWGFAIFAILDNRTQNSTVEKQGDAINRNLTLLTALLVLSTIPYSTGRSLTPQIWASCAIYLSLLFSLQIQDLPKVRGGFTNQSVQKSSYFSLAIAQFNFRSSDTQ